MTSTSANVAEQLRLGLLAARAGQAAAARRHFLATLHHDPNNVPALLWLAFLSPTSDDSLRLLKQVLAIDPGSDRAQAALRWLEQHRAQRPTAPPDSSNTNASQIDEQAALEALRQKLAIDDWPMQASKGPSAHRARRRIQPFVLLLVLFGGLIAGATLAGFAVFRPTTLLAAWSPAPEAMATSVPVVLPNPTATATSTPLPTDTPRPTDTPPPPPTAPAVAIDTPMPSPTPSPYKPANLLPGEKWIEVDVTTQEVTAWEGDLPVMHYVVSTGLPNTPTVLGQYRVYVKLMSTRMTGPGYDLPNVPNTMYFYSGYALHGTYWHNSFGTPMSRGCVNLSIEDSEALFAWANPAIPEGAPVVYASADNPGTRVIVHQ